MNHNGSGLLSHNERFSGREREIIVQLEQGFPVKVIAAHLGLAPNTVKDYLKSIYAKAQVHSARELLLRLYGNPEYEVRRMRQVDLMDAVEDMLAVTGDRVFPALVDGSKRCLGATRAAVWWWLAGKKTRPRLAPLYGCTEYGSAASEFFERVISMGTGVHAPAPARGRRIPGVAAMREIAALGLEEQVLGVSLTLPHAAGKSNGAHGGRAVLLVARSRRAQFTDFEAGACRLLARMAELQHKRKSPAAPALA